MRNRNKNPLTLVVAALVLVTILIASSALGAGNSPAVTGGSAPAAASPPPREPAAAADDAVITNDALELRAGVSGGRIGALTIIDRASGRTVGENLGQEVIFPGLIAYRAPGDFFLGAEPDLTAGVPTLLGPGQQLHLALTSLDGAVIIDLYVTLPDAGDSVFLQSAIRTAPEAPSPASIVFFRMPTLDRGWFDASTSTVFLSDATTVLRRDLYADDYFEEPIGLGSPVYVAGPGRRAIVMAWLDEPSRWPLVSLERRAPDLHLGFETGALGRLADRSVLVDEEGAAWSPRLLFDVADTDTRVAFEDYKRVMAALYPQPALPDWFGPQWDSYWVYDLDINEDNTLANANAIDTYFRDLGPWSIIFDAGWYVDGGRPDSAPDVLNYDKFPDGLSPVISYLKERGISSILYFSSPYLDGRESVDPSGFAGPPPWMALAGFLERYPDLVRSLTAETVGPSYVYDYLRPRMQEYLRYLMRLYLVQYDGDGILLDLVGEAGPSIADFPEDERAPGGRVPLVARQSLEVYRSVFEAATTAKPGALVEGSWLNPPLSRSYAQTWRYGDEVAEFNFSYPYNGLAQKLDYVILQRQMLGVRPHIGYLRGPGTATRIQQQWMGAGLALGAQFAVAVDFTEMTPEAAEVYRSFLAHYKPFTGFTFFGPGGLSPNWFATNREGVTYLAVVNRDDRASQVTIPLAELGLANGRQVISFEPVLDAAAFVNGDLKVEMQGQSLRFFVLRDTPGSVWGSRRTRESAEGGVVTVDVDASPLETGGRVLVFAPGSTVQVDAAAFEIDSAAAQFQRVSLGTGDAAQIRIVPAQAALSSR